jgi:uncharacterized protein YgbK (DUF1537 family)
MKLDYNDTIKALPSFAVENLKPLIRVELKKKNKTIIVLDDDPTGTQTIHQVPVLTVWDVEEITEEIERGTALFYILTNSRSMMVAEADALHLEIGENIRAAFEKCNKAFIIISRGDSTLRGHYPNDISSIAVGLECNEFHTAIIPAFFEGGRYTLNDIQYVMEKDELIPAAETSFAADKAFGYKNSDLKKWIEEKTKGTKKAAEVVSFSLDELRTNSVEMLSNKIQAMPTATTCIVNAADYYDLEKFTLAYLQSDAIFIFRAAASFVKAISGTASKELLTKDELVNAGNNNGGLIIVGSYVPKTTSQLTALKGNKKLAAIEVSVDKILKNEFEVTGIVNAIEQYIHNGKDVVVFSSRILKTGNDEPESLAIGNKVADFITAVVAQLQSIPKFIIAKGGITSSDIATKALNIKRAIVIG